MSAIIRTAIATVLMLALFQSGAFAAQTSSSASVTIRVVVSQRMQLSLPASDSSAPADQPQVRSNTPLHLSSSTGSPAVAAETSEVAAPDVLYTVVQR
jgi:hypothetical protein